MLPYLALLVDDILLIYELIVWLIISVLAPGALVRADRRLLAPLIGYFAVGLLLPVSLQPA